MFRHQEAEHRPRVVHHKSSCLDSKNRKPVLIDIHSNPVNNFEMVFFFILGSSVKMCNVYHEGGANVSENLLEYISRSVVSFNLSDIGLPNIGQHILKELS